MKTMTRKEFLELLALIGGAGAISGFVAACSKKEETPQVTARKAPAKSQPAARPQSAPDPCSDVSGLSEADLKMRNETLQYAAQSPDPAKVCDNCKFWGAPTGGQECGTCQLIKGPIHPKGYCTSWFAA